MLNFTRLPDIAKVHQREMLQVADTERMLRESEPEKIGFRDKLLLAVSDALIGVGRKLRAYAHRELVIPCDGMVPVESALPRP